MFNYPENFNHAAYKASFGEATPEEERSEHAEWVEQESKVLLTTLNNVFAEFCNSRGIKFNASEADGGFDDVIKEALWEELKWKL